LEGGATFAANCQVCLKHACLMHVSESAGSALQLKLMTTPHAPCGFAALRLCVRSLNGKAGLNHA
ncbi:MAG: hypothetical protein WCP31_12035, partial [Chloroflexales bacterium]